MGLMRFQAGRPKTGTPGPTPPFKKRRGRAGGDIYVLTPPRGVGVKKQNVPLPPRENLG